MKAVRGSEEDVCSGMLLAAACVDESDHLALNSAQLEVVVISDTVGT